MNNEKNINNSKDVSILSDILSTGDISQLSQYIENTLSKYNIESFAFTKLNENAFHGIVSGILNCWLLQNSGESINLEMEKQCGKGFVDVCLSRNKDSEEEILLIELKYIKARYIDSKNGKLDAKALSPASFHNNDEWKRYFDSPSWARKILEQVDIYLQSGNSLGDLQVKLFLEEKKESVPVSIKDYSEYVMKNQLNKYARSLKNRVPFRPKILHKIVLIGIGNKIYTSQTKTWKSSNNEKREENEDDVDSLIAAFPNKSDLNEKGPLEKSDKYSRKEERSTNKYPQKKKT